MFAYSFADKSDMWRHCSAIVQTFETTNNEFLQPYNNIVIIILKAFADPLFS